MTAVSRFDGGWNVDQEREQFLGAGATQFGESLEETRDQIVTWQPLLADSASERYLAVSATASR